MQERKHLVKEENEAEVYYEKVHEKQMWKWSAKETIND